MNLFVIVFVDATNEQPTAEVFFHYNGFFPKKWRVNASHFGLYIKPWIQFGDFRKLTVAKVLIQEDANKENEDNEQEHNSSDTNEESGTENEATQRTPTQKKRKARKMVAKLDSRGTKRLADTGER